MHVRHAGGLLTATLLGLLHPGCAGETTHRAGLADGCRLNSDCAVPFVCTSSVCHAACVNDRDCPGTPCVSSPEGNVCLLQSDAVDASDGDGGSKDTGGKAGNGGLPNGGGAGGMEPMDASVDASPDTGGTPGGGGDGAGGLGSGGRDNTGGTAAGGASNGGASGSGSGGVAANGGSGSGGVAADAGPPPPPPSCVGGGVGLSTCGAGSDEDCCKSLPVTGARTFYRSYDGVTATSQASPASVTDFQLDEFEITIARFRRFKAAWDVGYRPAAGTGKHSHLNGGQGLENLGGGGYESGWSVAWAGLVDISDATLGQCPGWSPSGTNESNPMPCISWYEAYAFCIWDGGFLPSEAEWNYAASGGTDYRVYPWSSPASSTTIDATRAVYCGASCSGTAHVGSKPDGVGRYGQMDLAGNVWEWTVDGYTDPYPSPCQDCALVPSNPTYRIYRGGSYGESGTGLYAAYRNWYTPEFRNFHVGARCARSP